jgi:hypothetical protein
MTLIPNADGLGFLASSLGARNLRHLPPSSPLSSRLKNISALEERREKRKRVEAIEPGPNGSLLFAP